MTETVKRLDPMKDVMHYELLKVAHMLVEREQNDYYWSKVPNPKRPVGQVRHEVARQWATFVVPALGLAAAGAQYGLKGLMVGFPVAWAAGFLMDKWLQRDIDRKLKGDMNVDRGRYKAVKWLAEQMGMRRDEVTLQVIYKMNEDYKVVTQRMKEEEARQQAAQAAAEARANERRRRNRFTRRDGVAAAAATGLAGGVAYAQEAYAPEDDYSAPVDMPSMFPDVNPTSGLPMIQGSPIDVGGNVFGTGGFMD